MGKGGCFKLFQYGNINLETQKNVKSIIGIIMEAMKLKARDITKKARITGPKNSGSACIILIPYFGNLGKVLKNIRKEELKTLIQPLLQSEKRH